VCEGRGRARKRGSHGETEDGSRPHVSSMASAKSGRDIGVEATVDDTAGIRAGRCSGAKGRGCSLLGETDDSPSGERPLVLPRITISEEQR
jgi:hypothetical protein